MLNKLIEDLSRVLSSPVPPKRGNPFNRILAYSMYIVGWDIWIDIP
jgi:hypothetical protein